MEDKESQMAICCSQARLPMLGVGCIKLNCWSGNSRGDPQTTQSDARTEGCSPETDKGVPLRSMSSSLEVARWMSVV